MTNQDFRTQPSFYSQGWECPKCGCIYSPQTEKCYCCSPFTCFGPPPPLQIDDNEDEEVPLTEEELQALRDDEFGNDEVLKQAQSPV
jgi:hypothetical protein